MWFNHRKELLVIPNREVGREFYAELREIETYLVFTLKWWNSVSGWDTVPIHLQVSEVQFVSLALQYILEYKLRTVRQGSAHLDPVRPAWPPELFSSGCCSVFLSWSSVAVQVKRLCNFEFPLSSSEYTCRPTSKCIFLFHGYEQSLCNGETKLRMQTLKL